MTEFTVCKSCKSGGPEECCTCGKQEEICADCELPMTICACDEIYDEVPDADFVSFKDTL